MCVRSAKPRRRTLTGKFLGMDEGGEPNCEPAEPGSWGEAGTPAGHLTARTRQLTSPAHVRRGLLFCSTNHRIVLPKSRVRCATDLPESLLPLRRHWSPASAWALPPKRRAQSGTASPPARAEATGPSTPAMVSTVACSSPARPGTRTAERATRPPPTGPASRLRSPPPNGSLQRRDPVPGRSAASVLD